MSDSSHDDGRTPLWGWVLIVAALTAFVSLIVHALSTGSGR
ncbi:MAG TPA: hypothetical protein VM076_22170 [Gemmatimonadaceae bacterium]|nr:hypothetical protein [Gemmatimonadaceae bacterium]